MRIACPNCAAAYEVPDQVLAAGPRLLRCTRCGHQFPAALAEPGAPPGPAPDVTPLPPAPPPAPPQPDPPPAAAPAPPGPPPPVESPAPPPGDRPPPTRGLSRHSPMEPLLPREADEEEGAAAPRSPALMAAAWVVSFAILGAAGWAAVTYRAAIAEAWPPAARLYTALGLD